MKWFEENGYVPPTMDEPGGQPQPSTPTPQTSAPAPGGQPVPREQFDVDAYLAANPDVAAAIRAGQFGRDPYRHYLEYGFRENRPGVSASAPQPGSGAASSQALNGFDQDKWDNQNHTTTKYQIGRILSKYPPTVEGLKQAIPELQAALPGLKFNGKDTLQIGLESWDVLEGASRGGVAWQFIPKTDAQGRPAQGQPAQGAGATGGTLGAQGSMNTLGAPGFGGAGGGSDFSLGSGTTGGGGGGYSGNAPAFESLAGFQAPSVPGATPTYTPTAITAQGAAPVYQAPSAFSYAKPVPGTYTSTAPLNAAKAAPSLEASSAFTYDPLKSTKAFKLPTGQEALNQDPGYQLRLDQGRGAIENSAASKGLLRTGGTWKGLIDYGQQMGSQEYEKAVNRSLGTYTTNQAVKQAEQGQQFGQNLSATQQNAAQRLDEFNSKLAASGQNFQQVTTQQGMNEAQKLAAYNANLTSQNQDYTQAANTSQMNSTNAFNAAGLNSANFNAGADRQLTAAQQNNAFGQSAAQFNAGQTQQGYENAFNASNAAYGYANQQNLAANAQAMQGYNIDTSANISQQQLNQGWQSLGLTAQQQAFSQSLSSQQQQWMQEYMAQGQSWDEAFRRWEVEMKYA